MLRAACHALIGASLSHGQNGSLAGVVPQLFQRGATFSRCFLRRNDPRRNSLPLAPQVADHPSLMEPLNRERDVDSLGFRVLQDSTGSALEMSVLERSGLRVATQAGGSMCNVGMYVGAGSMHESQHESGASHFLQYLSFSETQQRTGLQMAQLFQEMGGAASATAGREHFTYNVGVVPDKLPVAMRALADTVLHPSINSDTVDAVRGLIDQEYRQMMLTPQLFLTELLHGTAFNRTGLGMPLFCEADQLDALTAQAVRGFRERLFLGPRMVLSASGVDHISFLNVVRQAGFDDIPRGGIHRHAGTSPTEFTGGEAIIQTPADVLGPESAEDAMAKQGMTELSGGKAMTSVDLLDIAAYTHVMIGLPGVSWHDDRFLPSCVLQTLLGGGGSFSAGGPGKGMHTRLYANVLTRCPWMTAGLCFAHYYNDGGIMGLYGSAPPEFAKPLLLQLLQELWLCGQPSEVTEAEVARAKAQLKSTLMMNLETGANREEDVGRQLLMYDKYQDPLETCSLIDAITPDDVTACARDVFHGPVALTAYGADAASVPRQEEVHEWFHSANRARSTVIVP